MASLPPPDQGADPIQQFMQMQGGGAPPQPGGMPGGEGPSIDLMTLLDLILGLVEQQQAPPMPPQGPPPGAVPPGGAPPPPPQ